MRLAVLCNLSYFWVGLSASRIHHLVERHIFEQSSKFEVETPITFCVRRKMPVNIAPHICSRIASITLAGMQDGACRASWPDSLYIRLCTRAAGDDVGGEGHEDSRFNTQPCEAPVFKIDNVDKLPFTFTCWGWSCKKKKLCTQSMICGFRHRSLNTFRRVNGCIVLKADDKSINNTVGGGSDTSTFGVSFPWWTYVVHGAKPSVFF